VRALIMNDAATWMVPVAVIAICGYDGCIGMKYTSVYQWILLQKQKSLFIL
jgi:hypothetical protein